ncbi:hypothetical protein [Streptomyces sp. SID13031]|uniref:hypothetical protein n=1 Tax=Streptomyces sp. SID13031 TaxID=2706046 RepID=UPI0013C8C5DC|nr:hypothetical protein [Streptomyces sp. SID13031]NEA37241.1 hypothetical protein [Streptomyces sp. SID13031]
MRNLTGVVGWGQHLFRVSRGLITLTTVLALLSAYPAATASADTISAGNKVCSMYVNAIGFGAFCSSGEAYFPGSSEPPPTWKVKLGNNIFIPCRDFEIPKGINLGKAPAGKTWALRVTITDYDLNTTNGGNNVHLERAIVPLSDEDRQQCPVEPYMAEFWATFASTYPAPALQVMPTYTPRVNVPAYFSLTRESSLVLEDDPEKGDLDSAYFDPSHNLTMRGLVSSMIVDPGDGTPPFTCQIGVGMYNESYDGYDVNSDPFHQMSTCSHKYAKSSASQPDGMYTVKLTITWTVSYWTGQPKWHDIGTAEIHAVQRLPVQEVQSIGG